MDSVSIRGKVWVDGDEAKCVDYGEIPPNDVASADAAVYLVDEDLATSTGAAVCPGIDAVVKKLRVGDCVELKVRALRALTRSRPRDRVCSMACRITLLTA